MKVCRCTDGQLSVTKKTYESLQVHICSAVGKKESIQMSTLQLPTITLYKTRVYAVNTLQLHRTNRTNKSPRYREQKHGHSLTRNPTNVGKDETRPLCSNEFPSSWAVFKREKIA